ncbi:MAG TPA: Rieske (2Fe-2S) protein [Burkholderiales bacterium]
MENWVKVGSEAQFTDGLHTVKLGPRQNIVVARLNGKLFAFDALCPHAQGPMERSEVEGAIVSCPLHAWRFDLEAGGRELHGYRALTVHPLKVDAGEVYVSLAG